MSGVRCNMYYYFFLQIGGAFLWRVIINGGTPSSIQATMVLNAIIEINVLKKKW